VAVYFNHRVSRTIEYAVSEPQPRAFHSRLPGYAPTPLHRLTSLAGKTGVAEILLKDESNRLGLPAFKILGSSWAIYRKLGAMLGGELEPWSTIDDLAKLLAPLRPLELIAATEGNHGRSVARVAALLGFRARIFVPQGTVRDRIEAIEGEGASVTVVDGTYESAVQRAMDETTTEGSLLIQDTGWPGYEEIPDWVVQGYATMLHEIDDELAAGDESPPNVVFVQIGVGSLATAVISHYRRPGVESPPRIVGVEAVGATGAMESLKLGRPTEVPGPHQSIMVGLNCGSISGPAWPWLQRGLDAVVAVSDERAAEAMRALAAAGVRSGESGAAGLAGLIELLNGPDTSDARQRLELGPSTRVLALSTEGITDRDNYDRIIRQISDR